MFKVRAQIERLAPDSVKVRTLDDAKRVARGLLERNPDRCIRVTVTDRYGDVVLAGERNVSVPRCIRGGRA